MKKKRQAYNCLINSNEHYSIDENKLSSIAFLRATTKIQIKLKKNGTQCSQLGHNLVTLWPFLNENFKHSSKKAEVTDP